MYIYKKETHFFTVQKLAQYSLISVAVSFRLVVFRKLSIHQPTSRKPWEERQMETEKDRRTQKNRDIKTEMLQPLLIQRAGALMNKCEIQVTITTRTIICDALCWSLMSHSGCVGLLFYSHGKGTWSVYLQYAQIISETKT